MTELLENLLDVARQNPWLPITAGTLLAIASGTGLIRLWKSWNNRQRNTPQHLLKELCAAHRLRRRERKLIAQLAAELRLEWPALLFLEPALWEVARLGELGRRYGRELKALERQLFESATAG